MLALTLDGCSDGSLEAPVGIQGGKVSSVQGQVMRQSLDSIWVLAEGEGVLCKHSLSVSRCHRPRTPVREGHHHVLRDHPILFPIR
eukprot:9586-Rhodomonas_salina.1